MYKLLMSNFLSIQHTKKTLKSVNFWTTVCKTVHPMLSEHCPVLSCLSVCDVGVLWPNSWMIKMKLGMQVGVSPGHILLDGDPAPPPLKAHSPPNFPPICVVSQMDGWIKMPLGMEVTSAHVTLC